MDQISIYDNGLLQGTFPIIGMLMQGDAFNIKTGVYLDCFENAEIDAKEAVTLLNSEGVGLLARLELQRVAALVPPVEHFIKVVRV